MADRVVLHIGTMKSGTTYLQSVLRGGGLGESSGAWYPDNQVAAVQGVLGSATGQERGAWETLVAEVHARPGVAVCSQEFLSFARPQKVAEVVGAFGDVPVDVVLTVRDQHAALPAQWQSYVRNRGTAGWADYLGTLVAAHHEGRLLDSAGGRGRKRTEPVREVRTYRRAQDVATILRRWGAPAAGVSRVSVVTVPRTAADPSELWRRFCVAAQVGASEPDVGGDRVNESLGYASCEVLSRLNASIDALPRGRFRATRSRLLDVLLPLRPEEERPRLDTAGVDLARSLNASLLAALEHDDVHVVGDLDDLRAAVEPTPSVVPPDPAHLRRALEAAWSAGPGDQPPPDADVDALATALGRRLVLAADVDR